MIPNRTGILLENLPAIFHSLDDGSLQKLLSLFEAVWFGSGGDDSGGLERKIAGIADLFRPYPAEASGRGRTPEGFLAWLSEWVALSDRDGLSPDGLRRLIAHIVPLYAIRGTKDYLDRMLHYHLGDDCNVDIYDQEIPGLTVGRSTMGSDTRLGSDRPFFFKVVIGVVLPEDKGLEAITERARAVIDLAKPAHTYYSLECRPMAP